MSWRKVKLGDALDFYNGKAIKPSQDGAVPVYGSNGVIGRTDHKKYENAIIIGRVGAYCGSVAREEGSFWASDNTIVVKAKDCADIGYCYYQLSALGINHYAGGAAQPLITQTILNQITMVLPPLPVQQKIADVLGAYDELIENNRKRIALLEKMARELYRERFVRRAVEGVETFALEKIAKFVRGKVIVKDATKPGDVPVVAGGLEPAYYHDAANTDAPVVTVSGSGANAGFARMYFEKVWASDCSWVDVTTTKYIRFVYCFLKDNDAELRNAQKGAAQPHVHAKDVNALVVVAHIEQIAKFEEVATPLFDEVAKLTLQNRNLARQRDRLLPRLMSGKIDVEKLVKEGK